jgi:hypothetical protein
MYEQLNANMIKGATQKGGHLKKNCISISLKQHNGNKILRMSIFFVKKVSLLAKFQPQKNHVDP